MSCSEKSVAGTNECLSGGFEMVVSLDELLDKIASLKTQGII